MNIYHMLKIFSRKIKEVKERFFVYQKLMRGVFDRYDN